ncbi:5'-methylthioadenosine/adenosylhomocysteine nucleosidase [Helicobacter muridarum]|uniref:adenosylhomocysteine nucleosidase n=1 Tax=Helicobacter muridarum TaxID=216 RepID=A0A099U1Y1_9HELI|nr:5'-methylthioadenosine/adenosylhomocysteine nucleosidase [Helicobacter muridarum]TLE00891.1 5'-methylthioadenosine/adenosylhomocysteine nucleosidase [Helicobacter muridarum]STQ86665.1 5'-methylthioadenosine/S-adenosylhomocysteine nucleosidase [Helicobacter muridarum]
MTIGIIGAMKEEIAPLIGKYNNHKETTIGGNTYYNIKYNEHNIIIAYSKIGKVHSAISALVMILHFDCKIIIFSGVAGALTKDLRVGDLVVATKLCQHDVDISAFGHALGFIPEGKLFYDGDSNLRKLANEIGKDMGIEIKEGIIASGDQFIANQNRKEFIISKFNAIAVEMEGASVACVCDNFGIPFCVFRSISDAADMDASISFDEFLDSSAKISADFVSRMIDKILNQHI